MIRRNERALFARLLMLGLCLLGIGFASGSLASRAPSGVLLCIDGHVGGDGACSLLRLDR